MFAKDSVFRFIYLMPSSIGGLAPQTSQWGIGDRTPLPNRFALPYLYLTG